MADLKFRFIGGASAVGNLSLYVEMDGLRMLFEHGMTPSKPPDFVPPAPEVDAAFLTHSHLDHSGTFPRVARDMDIPVFATPPTVVTTPLLLYDTLKIARIEGHDVPFDRNDVLLLDESFHEVHYGKYEEIGPVSFTPHNAGHIPGSAMYEVNGSRSFLFTGDIQTVNTHLVWGCRPVKTEVLFVESTYAGREHPPRDEVERAFIEKIHEVVVDRGGKVIVPAFAVGRTQELLLVLAKLDYDMWLDGMGRTVNNIFLQNPEYLRSARKLKKARRRFNVVSRSSDRKRAMDGDVIVTTGGMLEGGPALHYINRLKDDEKSAILLTGYQVEGTNGRLLMDEGVLDLYGRRERIRMEVCFYDFSAHAGHSELVDFIRKCDPEVVVLCHGDNREALAEELRGEYKVMVPDDGMEYGV